MADLTDPKSDHQSLAEAFAPLEPLAKLAALMEELHRLRAAADEVIEAEEFGTDADLPPAIQHLRAVRASACREVSCG